MKRMITFLSIAALAACSSVTKDIEVDAMADANVDFSAYQTYGWVAASAIVSDAYAQWEAPGFDPVVEIKTQVDAALQKRGMTEDSVDPDVLVAFSVGLDMDALGVKQDPDTDTQMLANIPQGGLALLMADSQTGYLSWIGVATGDVQDNPDDETVKKRLEYAVSELIKKLPR